MLPGSRSFSIAVAGCNLRCKNCQNHTISQTSPLESNTIFLPPQKVVDEAKQRGCSSISYTYSEPTVWFEYMYDTAKIARKAGLKNVLVSCGYINTEPLRDLSVYLDGANIDLKSFDEKLYRNLNAGSLEPILSSLQILKEKGVWTEITNLVIPKWTDDSAMIKKMCHWIVNTISNDVPLHFSRFFPQYKLRHLFPTPAETLQMAKKIARESGIRYVYAGNVPGLDSNTYCPNCGALQIGRKGYIIKEHTIKGNVCASCGFAIAGVWT
jgi:pyruvate formate lyase activating enzyme